jgi:hypothetical protein
MLACRQGRQRRGPALCARNDRTVTYTQRPDDKVVVASFDFAQVR